MTTLRHSRQVRAGFNIGQCRCLTSGGERRTAVLRANECVPAVGVAARFIQLSRTVSRFAALEDVTDSHKRNILDLVLGQMKKVLESYMNNNDAIAMEVWFNDEKVGYVYNSIFREYITYMMEDPRQITVCTHLLFCAKNLERIGDHTTNMAESVHFMVTGQILSDQRPKGGQPAMPPAE